MKKIYLLLWASALVLTSCGQTDERGDSTSSRKPTFEKSESEWREILTSDEFHVLREKGTERAFTGAYWDAKEKGIYHCAACGNPLFDSSTKFDSGTGWPSFFKPITPESIIGLSDNRYGMERTEVMCSRCGGHLGHLFHDGPPPTGMRYCINSVSLDLKKKEGK